MKANQPKRIEMSAEDQSKLIERLKNSNIGSGDQEILTGIIEFNQWLQSNVQEKNITINRLQKIFGSKSEKRGKKKSSGEDNSKEDSGSESENTSANSDNSDMDNDSSEDSSSTPSETENSANRNQSKNSGRFSHAAYSGAEIIPVDNPYKPGEPCPEPLCDGKLKIINPGIVIKITGQSFAKATKYELEKLRCNLCEQYFTASLPSHVSDEKYDARFKAYLCVYKHGLGVPSYRLEKYQDYMGVPLPDSTQWDKIEEVVDDVEPAFKYLEHYASHANAIFADDTRVKIQSCIKENKKADKKRKGTFTTGIVAHYEGHQIHLFYNSRKHAGENIKAFLKKRCSNSSKPLYMCDALSSNMPKELKAIVLNCLVHARRNFVELESFFPSACGIILDVFSIIYKNEKAIRKEALNSLKRLQYHKQHTRPHVKKLYRFILNALRNRVIEGNSPLGKACRYMLRHAKRLTRFLRLPNASLDNNIVEQSLKMAIKVRKNSLFYATEHGAYAGGLLQSLIYTCITAKQNPVDYLTSLQEHKKQVRLNPQEWMPWNYLDTLKNHSLAA